MNSNIDGLDLASQQEIESLKQYMSSKNAKIPTRNKPRVYNKKATYNSIQLDDNGGCDIQPWHDKKSIIPYSGITKDSLIRSLSVLLEYTETGFIAGGSVACAINNDDIVGDIDVYFPSQTKFKKFVGVMCDPMSIYFDERLDGYRPISNMVGKILYEDNYNFIEFIKPGYPTIQLINMAWYKNVIDVIHSFDFTCVQLGLYGNTLYYSVFGLRDALDKNIRIHNVVNAESSIQRLLKYGARGYTMDRTSTIEFAEIVRKSVKSDIFSIHGNMY